MLDVKCKILFCAIFLVIGFFVFTSECFASNLLQNPGFEESDSGWNKYGSTQLNIVDNALNGLKAGMLTSSKTGFKYIYQDFDTFEGENFELSGAIIWNDDFISNAKLRVEWYDNSSKRVGLDEISLVSKSDDWQYLIGGYKLHLRLKEQDLKPMPISMR